MIFCNPVLKNSLVKTRWAGGDGIDLLIQSDRCGTYDAFDPFSKSTKTALEIFLHEDQAI